MIKPTIDNLKVSVVIPSYNSAEFLPEALESVLRQTYQAEEILVVDDGSTDNTEQVAARYSPQVTYIRQANQGVSAARNIGFEQSRGDWVCFLDADDLWNVNKLARQIEDIQRDPETLFSFTGYYLFGNKNGIWLPGASVQKWSRQSELLVPAVTILPSSSMVRRSTNIRFPCWASINEDSIYFNELADVGRFTYLDEPLVGYRKHPASAQANPKHVLLGCENLYRWAVEREQYDRSCMMRLLNTFITLAQQAKWKRDWQQYWIFREFVLGHWEEKELPPVFRTRVLPPLAYRIKDIWDSLRLKSKVRKG
jgi:glycosyltransferase involved in cell wall biosynthesis